ncbi:PfkB family carbohydrate kinase [Mangrovibacterium sp.]|uniref:PfkB family carbohydrate kinase n=1 Tax=Mangrovibacterium sp. TaxID=1961364 RepID=UPI00356787ED
MKKVVAFGEILLRLATEEHERFAQADKFCATYGGGEANVAISLANFGLQTEYITRVPANDIGEVCVRSLKKYGVGTQNIVFGGKRLGIYFLETGAVNRGSKVVYDREDSSFATLQPGMIDWDKAFDGADWFHWSGLSAAISDGATEVLAEGVKEAHKRGLTISCDINLRSNLWKYGKTPNEVMPDLLPMCDIIIGNEYDAEHAMGLDIDDSLRGKFSKESFLTVAQIVMKKCPKVKKIITTRRGSINASNNSLVGLVYNGKELIESREYKITHIVDRVGGGDAFAGAMIFGLINWADEDLHSLNFAVGASSLKHTISGDANLVSLEEVEEWMNGVGRISW